MSGVLNHSPQHIIQKLLLDTGGLVVTKASGDAWPCFIDVMPDKPDDVVTVTDTAGLAQGREMVEGFLFEKHGIIIRIRSDGPVDGYVKGARILQAITVLKNIPVTVTDVVGTATTTYTVISLFPKTGVIRIGRDKGQSKRWVWSIDCLTSIRIVS